MTLAYLYNYAHQVHALNSCTSAPEQFVDLRTPGSLDFGLIERESTAKMGAPSVNYYRNAAFMCSVIEYHDDANQLPNGAA